MLLAGAVRREGAVQTFQRAYTQGPQVLSPELACGIVNVRRLHWCDTYEAQNTPDEINDSIVSSDINGDCDHKLLPDLSVTDYVTQSHLSADDRHHLQQAL